MTRDTSASSPDAPAETVSAVTLAEQVGKALGDMVRDIEVSYGGPTPAPLIPPSFAAEVKKLSAQAVVSMQTLVDSGAMDIDTARSFGWTPPPVHTPRLTRWRWAIRSWWYDHRPHLHFGPCDYDEEDW